MDYIIDGVEEEIRDIVGSMIERNNNENNNFNRTPKMQCKYKMLKALLQTVSKSTNYLSNIRNLRIILASILIAGLRKTYFYLIKIKIAIYLLERTFLVASRNPSLITCELSDASSVELVFHPVALRTALIWSLVLVYSGLVAFLVTEIVNSTRQNRKVWARFLIKNTNTNRIWKKTWK